MKQTSKVQWFTLVELIVVITILAILWTIAFISLQWYSAQARDTTRVSDIQNIKKSLELFSLKTWKYPLPDSWTGVLYWTELETVWTQWTIWNTVSTNLSRNLNEKPTDPLTETEYTYSVINSQTKYELLSIYESDLVSYNEIPLSWILSPWQEKEAANLVSQTNAANANYPKISWNYNWIFVKTPTYYIPLPSIITSTDLSSGLTLTDWTVADLIITGWENNIAYWISDAKTNWLPNFTISSYSWTITKKSLDTDKQALAQVLINAYTWTILANAWIYQTIAETDPANSINLISLVDDIVLSSWTYTSTSWWDDNWDETPPAPTKLITSTDCTDADWMWVDSETDTMWDWFCISPRIEWYWDIKWISWNDSWTSATRREWDATWYSTTEWLADDLYWITAYLSNYTCWALDNWHTNVDWTYWDTIKWRMKWLSQFANMSDNYSALNSIDWINIDLNLVDPENDILPIPAIYIADCIDWVKNLKQDMDYTLNDWTTDTETWTNYISTTDNISTWETRNKYLLWWSESVWSHLPSAYSKFTSFTDNTYNWEYQVACELYNTNNSIWDFYEDWVDDSSSWDDDDWERIWLSAVGTTDGFHWGRYARIVGSSGCSSQSSTNAGNRDTTVSARFVVRP